MNNRELVQVRKYYELPGSISDNQIQKDLNNSLGLVVIRIEKAKKDLVKAFSKITYKF